LLSTYFGIYSSRVVFPEEAYLSKISKMYDSGLVEADVTSRSPTGWLTDKATECLSLGVGLEKKPKFGELFLDSYANPSTGYNPCGGLVSLSNGETQSIKTASYSRYWHGHATITQWAIFFLGLPLLKNLIWLMNFLLIYLIFKESSLISRTKKTRIVVSIMLLTYIALSDFADIHTSITHLLTNTLLFLTVRYFLAVTNKNSLNITQTSFVLGSIYCFILFGLNPQNIPIAILSWGLVILLTSDNELSNVLRKSILFLYGWGLGYAVTFLSKWIFVALLTDYDIFSDVKAQVNHRTSQNFSSLSEGVMQHLEFVSSLPVFLQAWGANFAALLIHVVDPRYAEKNTVIFISTALVSTLGFIVFVMFRGFSSLNDKLKILVAVNFVSFALLLSWYTILAQHSFDHATYTFRSLVIWLGGFIGSGIFIYLGKSNLRNLNFSKYKGKIVHRFRIGK
jgi:hypothetical protein